MTRIDVSEFRERGAVLVKGFFRREEVERVRQDAKRVFLAQLLRRGLVASEGVTEKEFEAALFEYFRLHLSEFVNCGKQAQHLISLHRLSLDARVTDTLAQLGMEFPNVSTRPVLYFNSRHLAKEEVYWRVFAHQDWRSMQGSLDSVVVWVPLADVDASLGALQVVPGSHRLGLLTTEVVNSFGKVDRFKDEDFVSVEVEQGDALVFSSLLVHRSGVNVTDSIRWSCHFRYNNLAEGTFIERGYPHPYLYKPQEELITPGFPSPDQVGRIFLPAPTAAAGVGGRED
ncbi:MAG TPA: phytanoyl-CoA dioxygenase family protein [Pyrinomonadaceae bacterium]|nr:phytanoyl-CoA dioxygenase family protein [Pyrinomonadaceae bacterium]